MTLSQFTLVSAGITANALTFVLGILVGCSLMRKEANDRNSNKATEGSDRWHVPINFDVSTGTRCRKGGCANAKPKADSAERAPGQRRDHGERS
jgi:hypothetical protein